MLATVEQTLQLHTEWVEVVKGQLLSE